MKVAGIGSMNMDMIIHADKIPLKGETVKGGEIEYQPGGKGANQAVAIAKLGTKVTMFGCVGNDSEGRSLVENLNGYGIGTDCIRAVDDVPTGRAVITVGDNDNTILIIAGANNCVDVDYIKRYKEKILEADIIVLQNEIPKMTVEYVIQLCYVHKKTTIWNPAPARAINEDFLEKVTYLTPNEHEVQEIWGSEDGMDMESLLKRYPGKLIITRGEQGVSLCTKEGSIITIPAMKVKVKDTTGAGDTLNGAFCVGLACGMDEVKALEFANVAAGLSVQKCGAQTGMPKMKDVWNVLENKE